MTYKNAARDNTELSVDQVLKTYTAHVRNGIETIRNRQKADISLDDLHDALLVRQYHLYQEEPTSKQTTEHSPSNALSTLRKRGFGSSYVADGDAMRTIPKRQATEYMMRFISELAYAEQEFKLVEDYCIKSVPGYFTEWAIHSFFMRRTPLKLEKPDGDSSESTP